MKSCVHEAHSGGTSFISQLKLSLLSVALNSRYSFCMENVEGIKYFLTEDFQIQINTLSHYFQSAIFIQHFLS